ncbi:aldehyde dehydrogenase family protein, partial [candidate division KSB1 bacterium]|nr:aldehyde dehydrogenase family protein [candidate division KSB1 bacterium]
METYFNHINGEWTESSTAERFDNRNPANWNEIIGTFPKSDKKDVDAAVRSARSAYSDWRLTPAPKRGEYLKVVGDIMTERKEELARLMTREMGKVLKETRGDVQEGIDFASEVTFAQ